MARSEQPRRAEVVTKPSRSECPLNRSASSPAASAARFTTLATVSPSVLSALTFPCRSTLRNSGPLVIRLASSHARSVHTGHSSALAPNGIG